MNRRERRKRAKQHNKQRNEIIDGAFGKKAPKIVLSLMPKISKAQNDKYRETVLKNVQDIKWDLKSNKERCAERWAEKNKQRKTKEA